MTEELKSKDKETIDDSKNSVMSVMSLGFLTSKKYEMNAFIDYNSDLLMDFYMKNNFKDYQLYDFNISYKFKFPLSIGFYGQFNNSYKPGGGLALATPFTSNGSFIDPYVTVFYDFGEEETGVNVGINYAYSFFSFMVETDFLSKEGFDMLLTDFYFFITKKIGIYLGFNMFHDLSIEYKAGFIIKID